MVITLSVVADQFKFVGSCQPLRNEPHEHLNFNGEYRWSYCMYELLSRSDDPFFVSNLCNFRVL